VKFFRKVQVLNQIWHCYSRPVVHASQPDGRFVANDAHLVGGALDEKRNGRFRRDAKGPEREDGEVSAILFGMLGCDFDQDRHRGGRVGSKRGQAVRADPTHIARCILKAQSLMPRLRNNRSQLFLHR